MAFSGGVDVPKSNVPITHGAIQSGYMSTGGGLSPFISSGQVIHLNFPASLSSGFVASGLGTFMVQCIQCAQLTHRTAYIRVNGLEYCFKCASFDPDEGFTRRAEDILRSVPCHDAPWSIVADWLEDNDRLQDATWVRNNRC